MEAACGQSRCARDVGTSGVEHERMDPLVRRTTGRRGSSSDTLFVEFNGERFRRYPLSTRRGDRVYYQRVGGSRSLHRAIWEYHHGRVPDGFHVHHIDFDPLNNTIGNLECLPGSEHLAGHAEAATPEQLRRKREHVERIRPLTKAWHSSDEGRAWHSQHGINVFRGRPKVLRSCELCGKPYESSKPGSGARFCSNNCKSTWRRRAGIDDVQRVCSACGAVFTVNRYCGSRACSRTCAGTLQSRTKLNRRCLRPDS